MPTDTIDKATFLAALDCRTTAWHAHRAPQAPITPGLAWLFYGGNAVGAAARAQLGDGVMLPRAPLSVACQATEAALTDAAATLLFEASFQWTQYVARADALRRSAGGWELIEVKSAKEPKPEKKLAEGAIDDLAYTVMVARGAGVAIVRCTLMLLSRSYRHGGPGELLVEFDVTANVMARVATFSALAPAVAVAVLGTAPDEPELKLSCRKCDYFATTCLGAGVAQTIFMLPALSEKRLGQIKPIVDLQQLPFSVDLTENQRRVFEVMRSGKPLLMDGLADLDRVRWPAYYLDFETVSPVLPWFDGDGLSEVHTFQYSIHRCATLGQVESHYEYLASDTGDWRRALVEQMLADLGASGSIIVYTDFEETRLKEMAALFPDLAPQLADVIGRLFDLNDVIKRGYCHPGFKGSTSIKKVLPVMVPALGYAGMAIGEGQSASGVFGLMRVGEYPPVTFADWRRDLLAYCKLDTLAMVQVHDALLQVRRSSS